MPVVRAVGLVYHAEYLWVVLLLILPIAPSRIVASDNPGRIGVYATLEKEAQSPEMLRQEMKRIKASGIDFINCAGKDHAIFWDSKIAPKELIKNSTYLETVLRCAHEEGLKVYPVFCVAIEGGEREPNILLQRHPSWSFFFEGARRGYIDPGNREARSYEASLAAELVSKYNVDGLSLDYARCPNRIGYTDSGRAEFLKKYNVDLATVVGSGSAALDTEGGKKTSRAGSADARANPIWPEWRKWKMEQINNLVRELGAAVRNAKPGLPISSYVWGYHTYTGNFEVCQDWVTWIDEGILNWINPSGYRYDEASFRQAAGLNREHVPANFPYYITIGVRTSHGSLKDANEIRKQMNMAAEAGADGLVFFTWEALRPFADELANDIKSYRRRDGAHISSPQIPVAAFLDTAVHVAATANASAASWPQFRGPNASGVADEAHPPTQFGPDTNLLWKVVSPPGISAPVIWGGHLFLTGFVSNQLVTLAYDVRNGRELWRRIAPAERIEACHDFSSPAASTPCTDGERVYAYFGSFGLLAYDFDGKEIWRHPLERLPSQYGTATSPILAGGQLILQHDGDSTNAQLVALAPKTGETVWESPRSLDGASYSTPMVWRHDRTQELIVQGKGRVAAYDLGGGPPKWWVKGWGFSAVTTPVAGDGILFVGGSGMGDPSQPDDPLFDWKKLIADFDANKDGQLALTEVPESLIWQIRKELPIDVPGNAFPMRSLLAAYADTDKNGIVTKAEWDAMNAFAKNKFNADRFVAIRPGGQGDSTDTHVQWETTKGLSEMPSPLFYQGRIHFLRDGGLWTVIEPMSGKRVLDRERLGTGGQAIASPIAAHGHIYTVNAAGTFTVLRSGDTFQVVAVNKLGESVRCTPAIASDTLFVRSAGHLWAFGK